MQRSWKSANRNKSEAGSRVPASSVTTKPPWRSGAQKKKQAHANASATRKVSKPIASPLSPINCNNNVSVSGKGDGRATGLVGSRKPSAASASKGSCVSSRRPASNPVTPRWRTPTKTRTRVGEIDHAPDRKLVDNNSGVVSISNKSKPDVTRDGEAGELVVSPSNARRAEEEILAAFSQTPNMRRTPPRGDPCTAQASSTGGPKGRVTRDGEAGELVVSPSNARRAEEEILAAFSQTPKMRRTPPRGDPCTAQASSTGGPKGRVTRDGEAGELVVSPSNARRAEEEILAAFSQTPKMRRTPPRGDPCTAQASSTGGPKGRVTRDGEAGELVVSPSNARRAEEEILAAFSQTPKMRRTPPRGDPCTAQASSTGGPKGRVTRDGEAGELVVSPSNARRAEEEILAAFSHTPKMRRTPPRGGPCTAQATSTGSAMGRLRDEQVPVATAIPASSMSRATAKTTKQQGSEDANADRARQSAAGQLTAKQAYVDAHVVETTTAVEPEANPLQISLRRAEKEILAAFSQTPKMRRTPPRGDPCATKGTYTGNPLGMLSDDQVPAGPAIPVSSMSRAMSMMTEQQQGLGEANADRARQRATGPSTAKQAHADSPVVEKTIAVEHEVDPVPFSLRGAGSHLRDRDINTTKPRAQGKDFGVRGKNKFARSLTQKNGEKASESIETRALHVGHQPEAAEMGGSEEGAELRGMEEVTIDTGVHGKVVGKKDGDTVGQGSEKPRDDVPPPRASPPLERLPPPETAATGQKYLDGPTEPATEFAVTGSASGCASPAAKSAGSDLGATSDDSRNLGESAPVEGPLGRDATRRFGGKVTPKVLKNVAAGMRTPVTGMDRFGCPRGKVAAMKSLYLLGSEQSTTAKGNPPASSQPAAVPRPSTMRAQAGRVDTGVRYSSSSVEAAAAAAAAAAAKRDASSGAVGASSKNRDINNASIGDGRSETLVAAAEGEASKVDASGKPGPSSPPYSEDNGDEPRGTFRSGEASCASSDASREARSRSDVPEGAGSAPVATEEALDPFLVSEKLSRTSLAAQVPLVDEVIAARSLQGGEGRGRSGSNSGDQEDATAPAQGGKDQEAGPLMDEVALVPDPFASKSKLPRTPIEEATSRLLGDKGGTSSGGSDSGGGGGGVGSAARFGGAGQGVAPVDLTEAQMQIGELRREMACMADRIDKQTDERERLAEIALQGQDEVADLRKQLQDLREKQQREEEDVGTGSGVGEGTGAGEVGGGAAPRHGKLEFAIAKWDSEVAKREAKEKTRHATIASEKARAELKELQVKERAMRGKWLEEQLLRAREQCEKDEKTMDERQLEVKLFVAEVAAEEKKRQEQGLREALVSLAGKARVMVEDFMSRNEKMAERVAGLRQSVKEREHIVSQLTEKVTRLEDAGRSANEKKLEARKQLQEANEGLTAARERGTDLEARLGPLENEHRDAQLALEHLRELVSSEEARRVSLEQRLSDAERAGDKLAEMERSRRQSTERRLGAAERARDELAAAEAASFALQAATQAERERRLSAERRLDEAVRARDELSATVAKVGITSDASADVSGREEGQELVQCTTLSDVPEVGEGVIAMESGEGEEDADATDETVEVLPMPVTVPVQGGIRKVSKRARSMDHDDCSGNESPPAKAKCRDKKYALVASGPSGKTKLISGGSSQGRTGSGSDFPASMDVVNIVHDVPVPAPVGATTRKLRQRSKVNYTEEMIIDESSDKGFGLRSARAAPKRVGSRSRPGVVAPESKMEPRSKSLEAMAEEVVRSPPEETSVCAPGSGMEAGAGDEVVRPVSAMDVNVDSEGGQPKSAGDGDGHAASTAGGAGAGGARSVESVKMKPRRARKVDRREREPEEGGEARATRRSARSARSKGTRSRPSFGAVPVASAHLSEACPGKKKKKEGDPRPETLSGGGLGKEEGDVTGGLDGDDSCSVAEKIPEQGGKRMVVSGERLASEEGSRGEGQERGKGSDVSQMGPADGESARGRDSAARTKISPVEHRRDDSRTFGPDAVPVERMDAPEEDVDPEESEGENARELPQTEAVGRDGGTLEMEDGGKPRAGRKRSIRRVATSPEEVVKTGLSDDSTSSLPPHGRKRPRKLLGRGTSRCKTPKGKGKAVDGCSSSTRDATSATSTLAVPDRDAVDARSSGVKVGVGPRSGQRASLEAKSAPAVGSVSVDGVSSQGGGVASAGGSGVERAVNPAVKTKKRSTSSIFAMRGKAPIRGSLFKGFVDPKKGFTVPKLKAGVSRR